MLIKHLIDSIKLVAINCFSFFFTQIVDIYSVVAKSAIHLLDTVIVIICLEEVTLNNLKKKRLEEVNLTPKVRGEVIEDEC